MKNGICRHSATNPVLGLQYLLKSLLTIGNKQRFQYFQAFKMLLNQH